MKKPFDKLTRAERETDLEQRARRFPIEVRLNTGILLDGLEEVAADLAKYIAAGQALNLEDGDEGLTQTRRLVLLMHEHIYNAVTGNKSPLKGKPT